MSFREKKTIKGSVDILFSVYFLLSKLFLKLNINSSGNRLQHLPVKSGKNRASRKKHDNPVYVRQKTRAKAAFLVWFGELRGQYRVNP